MLKQLLIALMFVCVLSLPAAADDKPMTNADVISLVKAKMSEDTILMSIRSSKAGFDTSAKGIIALSNAGVPEPIVQAMIEANAAKASGGTAATAGTSGGKVNPNAINPETVILNDGDTTQQMKYLTPSFRHAARALGWGGMSQYAVLQNSAATLRLKTPRPSFVVAIPNNAQPESYYTIANFAVRNNNTREVSVGSGGYYASYSTGIHKDRVILATAEKEASQAKAPPDYTLYRVTPNGDLKRGEYAFILYNSQIRTAGWFASGLDSYFDFGVD